MRIPLSNRATNSRGPWRALGRTLVLLVGLAGSAVLGYLTVLAVMIVAVALGAAPLLAGDSTPQQRWVTPVAVGAGVIVFGLGCWVSARTFRRRR